jgi:hypothetical protein
LWRLGSSILVMLAMTRRRYLVLAIIIVKGERREWSALLVSAV